MLKIMHLLGLVLLFLEAGVKASDATGNCAAGGDETSFVQLRQSVERRGHHGLEEKIASLQQRGEHISHNFVHAAKHMPDGPTKSLFQTFALCGKCSSYDRWGEAYDGGYLMCMDSLQKGGVRAAYSLGVEKHDQWSEDAAKNLDIVVNQFDCTVEESACKHCAFYKACIVSADGKHPVKGHESESISLADALTLSGQGKAPENSLIMKMDTESSEWPLFAHDSPDVLKKFSQLLVEFHWLEKMDRHPEYLQAMQHILASGFKVAHLHGNNCQPMVQVFNTTSTLPRVLEVTFVKGDDREGGCLRDQEYLTLDSINNAGIPELPMFHIDTDVFDKPERHDVSLQKSIDEGVGPILDAIMNDLASK